MASLVPIGIQPLLNKGCVRACTGKGTMCVPQKQVETFISAIRSWLHEICKYGLLLTTLMYAGLNKADAETVGAESNKTALQHGSSVQSVLEAKWTAMPCTAADIAKEVGVAQLLPGRRRLKKLPRTVQVSVAPRIEMIKHPKESSAS